MGVPSCRQLFGLPHDGSSFAADLCNTISKKLRRQGLILFSLRIWSTAKAAARDERRLFGSGIGIVHELEGIIAQVLKLEAVGFVGFVVERIQLVDGKLVELIEVRPSFSAF